jgi:cytochrome c-type biogenesis protein CcsB
MPLDSFARNLASQLTGRETWREGTGPDLPDGYAGRHPIQLLCDLLFRQPDLIHKPFINIESRPFKSRVGFDPAQRFFPPTELVANLEIEKVLREYDEHLQRDPAATPTKNERVALDIQACIGRLNELNNPNSLALIHKPGEAFARVGLAGGEPGTEPAREALKALQSAYLAGGPMDAPVDAFIAAVHAAGTPDPAVARTVSLEHFYNQHRPWRQAIYGYALSLVLFGISRIALRRPLFIAAILAAIWGVAEHVLGLGLRIAILQRAPVSNTYEALLWMGLVAIAIGLIGQLVNRKAWYLFAGIAMAELSVLFSNLVPLESQTNSLPAVLRSNYWLIVHVLTIVASYGVLGVASLLGHVYLVKEVLLRKSVTTPQPIGADSNPLIIQTYRAIQIGLFLLTAGTILGGVWAADSWGRFWGWDPKETWALISIIVYFIVLHARYVRWVRDFGMAASAVLSFAVIVWTFYGVNYLMASGLHSYGFGSGGGLSVGIWAGAEIVFVAVCKLRHASGFRITDTSTQSGSTQPIGPEQLPV